MCRNRLLAGHARRLSAYRQPARRLRLEYPDLTRDAREEIWRNMLHAASLQLSDETVATLAERKLNGKQIRNLGRLARILHPQGRLSLENMKEVLQFGVDGHRSGKQ